MSEADRSDLQYARDRWRRTREDSYLHRRSLLVEMGSVFGPAIRLAVEEHMKGLIESAEGVVRYYERAIEALEMERSELRAEVDRLLATAVPAQGKGVEDAL